MRIQVDKSEKMGLFHKSLIGIGNFFLFRVPMNPYKDWKAKLERPHFFKVHSGKITVCLILQNFHGLIRI